MRPKGLWIELQLTEGFFFFPSPCCEVEVYHTHRVSGPRRMKFLTQRAFAASVGEEESEGTGAWVPKLKSPG